MILWIVLLVILFLVALFPLGISAQYDQQGALVWIVAGPFRFRVYPSNRKKSKTSGKSNQDGFESHAKTKEKNGKLTDFLPLVRLIIDFLLDFRTKLRINHLELKIILAGGDPCDLSINYGRAWTILGNVMPLLERCFIIKKRNLEIECDYTADSILINGYVHMTVTVAQLLTIGIYHGVKVLHKYIQITKKTKDGATS